MPPKEHNSFVTNSKQFKMDEMPDKEFKRMIIK
jgi:hypothetical protein